MAAPGDDADPTAQLRWPRAGASAIVFRGTEVLLVERGKGALAGVWAPPGGHIEPGETALAAAVREVGEETGIVAELSGLVDVHDIILRGPDGVLSAHYLLAVYHGRHLSGEPCPASDARAARFVPLDDLDRLLLTPGARGLIARALVLAGA